MNLNNKSLLITGGTGSFGNAVLKKYSQLDLSRIIIFSRDEKKQDEMRHLYPDDRIQYVIGDIRDYNSVEKALFGVDYVFHAAALKQVPSCEFHPIEAIKTNALGTDNVCRAAIQSKVKKLVLLSTDKAVLPLNVMGLTKGLSEKIMLSYASIAKDNKITFCATRYGNVLCSRGSVVPLFLDQIKKKTDLTITDPKMTRFLMTLDEAVGLVEYAFRYGACGDIMVKRSPASNIENLAKAVCQTMNVKPKFKVIGVRHGEKLFESLATAGEIYKSEQKNGFFRIPKDSRNLNYEQYVKAGTEDIPNIADYTSNNTQQLTQSQVQELLLEDSNFTQLIEKFNEH